MGQKFCDIKLSTRQNHIALGSLDDDSCRIGRRGITNDIELYTISFKHTGPQSVTRRECIRDILSSQHELRTQTRCNLANGNSSLLAIGQLLPGVIERLSQLIIKAISSLTGFFRRRKNLYRFHPRTVAATHDNRIFVEAGQQGQQVGVCQSDIGANLILSETRSNILVYRGQYGFSSCIGIVYTATT